MSEITPATAAIFALSDALNAEWATRMGDSPRNARLKAIALAMFKMHHGDADPNQPTMGFAGGNPTLLERVGNGTVAIRYPLQPAWVTYLGDARTALDIVEQS